MKILLFEANVFSKNGLSFLRHRKDTSYLIPIVPLFDYSFLQYLGQEAKLWGIEGLRRGQVPFYEEKFLSVLALMSFSTLILKTTSF